MPRKPKRKVSSASAVHAQLRPARTKKTKPEPGTAGRTDLDRGADYDPVQLDFLRRVDRLRRAKPFPAATDYLRLAVESLQAAGRLAPDKAKKGKK